MSPTHEPPTIYALMIGIDDYRADLNLGGVGFPKLQGCVNDTKRVMDYLQNETNLKIIPFILRNSDATKSEIVNVLRTKLTDAREEDTILIYYSGHGTVEIADTNIWTDESDGRLEALVCYYDHVKTAEFLMTDKELRFLIHELYAETNAHIVTIFDCCHSGDNTRSVVHNNVVARRVDFEFPKRAWDDFIFSENYKLTDFVGKSISEVLPQGAHVQMSASESNEPALEVGGQGVFTKHLIKALTSSGGNISYADLQSRVRNKMRAAYQQKPKLYTPNAHSELKQKGFLNQEIGSVESGSIVYDKRMQDWVLNRGVLHGIDELRTKITLDLPNGNQRIGKVVSTDLDSTLISFQDDDGIDIFMDYQVTIDGIKLETIKLRIINRNVSDKETMHILNGLSELENKQMLTYVDEADQADYDLVLWNDLCYLTLPECSLQPLVEPVYTDNEKISEILHGYLSHISGWTYQKNIENNGSNKIPDDYLTIEFEFVDAFGNSTVIHPDANHSIPIELTSIDSGQNWSGSLKIKVTNNTKGSTGKDLYVAGIYMPLDFSAQTGLFEPQVKMIEPGKSETIFEKHNGIPFEMDDKWYWYNWKKEEQYLNFIFSTSPFSEDSLQKEALPAAWIPDVDRLRKGLNLHPKKTILEGWNIKSFKLIFQNPLYDQDNEFKVEHLIRYDQELEKAGHPTYIGHFASGLYLEQDGLGKTVIKPSKENTHKPKGIVMTSVMAAANKWASAAGETEGIKRC